MTLPPLERLLQSGLKKSPPNDREIENLIRSAERRLHDATSPSLSLDSRFDLAYNAAHAHRTPNTLPFGTNGSDFPSGSRNA